MMEKMATILSTKPICKEPGRYIGWPTITKTHQGELLVVFSGDRDQHVCPFGKTELVRSRDGGQTWTEPVVITNTPLDDRDAGIIQTRRGTLLVSWFTSTGFVDKLDRYRGKYGDAMVDGWKEKIESTTDEVRRQWLGNWVRRSTDGGNTWQDPIRTKGSAPHGPIELADGRLIYVGCARLNGETIYTVEESTDDGCSWEVIATIPHEKKGFGEPHLAETATGRLVAMFRYSGPEDFLKRYLHQSESEDGGKTWSTIHPTPIWGYPPHLTRLRNDWLLVVYGRRVLPLGQRACISTDEGATWDVDREIVLNDEAPSKAPFVRGTADYRASDDLGYPASVQLEDGSILTVYYQVDVLGELPCLMGTHWRLEEAG